MTANDRLAEIQARAEKATDGPWRHSVERERYETAHYVRHGEGEHLAVFTGNYSGASEDGEFIAHARTDVPALAAALEEALDACAEIRVNNTGTDFRAGGIAAASIIEFAIENALKENR